MYFEEILKEFLFDYKIRKLSERSITSYRNNNLSLFRYITTEFNIAEVEEVNHKVLQAYISYLSDKGLRESYGRKCCISCYYLRSIDDIKQYGIFLQ